MILNYTSAKLKSFIIHEVGNKLYDDKVILSDSSIENLDNDTEALLVNYFLSPFKQSEYYTFWHESDLALNAVFTFVKEIFANRKSFTKNSKSIAKHLYEQSTHPKIKQGELYISFFENCILDDQLVDIISIFKSESKNTLIQTYKNGNQIGVKTQEGTSIEKVDKGCVIFSNKIDDSFKVCTIDNLSKSADAQYWKDDFLKVTALSDDYHFTKNFLSLTKQFITSQVANEFDLSKTDQINLLNKSVQYFNENETFNIKLFEKEVFEDPGIINSFRNYGSAFVDKNNIEISDRFEISDSAVKKQARIFKSVLKLDKNFHIYIHGEKELIEKGYDEKRKMNYYKVYFKDEQ